MKHRLVLVVRVRGGGDDDGRVIADGNAREIHDFVVIEPVVVVRALRGCRVTRTAGKLRVSSEGAPANGGHCPLVRGFHGYY